MKITPSDDEFEIECNCGHACSLTRAGLVKLHSAAVAALWNQTGNAPDQGAMASASATKDSEASASPSGDVPPGSSDNTAGRIPVVNPTSGERDPRRDKPGETGTACDRCGARDTTLKNESTFLFCFDRDGCDARRAKKRLPEQRTAEPLRDCACKPCALQAWGQPCVLLGARDRRRWTQAHSRGEDGS